MSIMKHMCRSVSVKRGTAASANSDSQLDFELLTAVTGVIHQCAADVLPIFIRRSHRVITYPYHLYYAGCIPCFGQSGSVTWPTSTTHASRLRATANALCIDDCPRTL